MSPRKWDPVLVVGIDNAYQAGECEGRMKYGAIRT